MKENGSMCSIIRGGHQGAINSLLRVDEDKIASGSADHFIRVFSINSKSINTPLIQFEQ
jgi:WD40 repeat protein